MLSRSSVAASMPNKPAKVGRRSTSRDTPVKTRAIIEALASLLRRPPDVRAVAVRVVPMNTITRPVRSVMLIVVANPLPSS